MADASGTADHWGRGDVYELIVSALPKAGKSLEALTVEDLAPVDHYHAHGFPARLELGDRLPIKSEDHSLDIGCDLSTRPSLSRRFLRGRLSASGRSEIPGPLLNQPHPFRHR